MKVAKMILLILLVVGAFVLTKKIMPLHVYIPSGSMMPTYDVGDTDWISKYKEGDSISRKDIVVFHAPDESLYIKRVIGIPGDTVQLTASGSVYINNSLLKEPYLYSDSNHYNEQVFEVPDGAYFVMGDNRANSLDSRAWENPFILADSLVAVKKYEK